MESRSDSCRASKFIGPVLLIAGLAIVLVFGPGCGARPDSTTGQFYERLAALDIGGMSQLVCEGERATFRRGVEFLESAPSGRALRLEDFEARTESSDGTSATMKVSGRFLADELGEMGLSGRVRLVRDGSEWCISGERDGFRSVWESAEDVFALLIRGGISRDAGWYFPEGVRPGPVELVTPPPAGPPAFEGQIVVTGSGLRYVEIQAGTGQTPEPGQTVLVQYTLWVEASGVMIDTSEGREPLSFVLGGGEVVEGFDEGVATMQEGGRRRLIVPPKLGYGDDDDYGDIPPNSTLVFDVELVEVR